MTLPKFCIVLFYRYNASGTGKLSIEELKIMMEKLGAPQTHLGLKEMIKVRVIRAMTFFPNFISQLL